METDMLCNVSNDHRVSLLLQTHFTRPFIGVQSTAVGSHVSYLQYHVQFLKGCNVVPLSAQVLWKDCQSMTQMGKPRVSMLCLLLLLLLLREQGWPVLNPRDTE